MNNQTQFQTDNKTFLEESCYKCINKLRDQEDILDPKTLAGYRLYLALLKQHDNYPKQSRQKKAEPPPPPEIPNEYLENASRFAENVLGIELLEHQKKLCDSDKRLTMLIAGRGAGKTVGATAKAIHRAISKEKHTVLVVSSGQRMSSEYKNRIAEMTDNTLAEPWIKSATDRVVDFVNGSTVHFLPCNPETIRGFHPKSLKNDNCGITIILDEACFMENGDKIRAAVEYATITTNNQEGQIVIVSSPTSTRSWVYQLCQDEQDQNEVITCGSDANPLVTEEEIERLKQSKNEIEFRAEVKGEWVDGVYSLFAGVVTPNIKNIPLGQVPNDAVCALGVDLALSYNVTNDRNALVVLAKWWNDNHPDTEPNYRVIDCKVLDRPTDNDVKDTAKFLIEEYKIQLSAIEQYQGKALHEYCEGFRIYSELINPNPGLQQSTFHLLHSILKNNRIEIPKEIDNRLIDELQNFEYRRDENGKIHFEHPTKGHDDTVYALAWALHATGMADKNPQSCRVPVIVKKIPKRHTLPGFT
jgi:hypothetical protein